MCIIEVEVIHQRKAHVRRLARLDLHGTHLDCHILPYAHNICRNFYLTKAQKFHNLCRCSVIRGFRKQNLAKREGKFAEMGFAANQRFQNGLELELTLFRPHEPMHKQRGGR